MIKITRKAIDSTLKETAKAYRREQLEQFQLGIEERVRQEQPILADYIDSVMKD